MIYSRLRNQRAAVSSPFEISNFKFEISHASLRCHGSHLAENLQHFVMDEAVAGDAFLAVDGSRLTFEVRNPAAGLPDHQISRRAIPGAELQFPKPVEATRGNVAEVQRRRTRSPHR